MFSKFVVLLSIIAIVSGLQLCHNRNTCGECTASGALSCRWCPRDKKCHMTFSPVNPCKFDENVKDSDWCECHNQKLPNCCTCQPTPGETPSVCSWYTQSTNSPNPREWSGADFLPRPYISAAVCACSGNGDPSWLSASASCVRTQLRQLHIDLSDDMKREMQKATLSGERSRFLPYVGFVKKMHDDAYAKCCCKGAVAPYVDWLAIFYAGNLLPCPLIVESIQRFGRCGCGW